MYDSPQQSVSVMAEATKNETVRAKIQDFSSKDYFYNHSASLW